MANRKAPREKVTLDPASEAWNKIPWRKLEHHVYRIQKRIYQARQRGNVRTVQKLQKLLMKSEAARLLAVRRVTQENQGKKTSGVDGVKNVLPKQRIALAEAMHPRNWKDQKPKPVRRVWIPKPGKAEKRPLGIPVMHERAKQALVKISLEPEWEAVFEANSYGFRPGRSCQDAIEAIYNNIRYKQKFVLDADIKGCFDNIDQEALLKKLQTFTAMRHVIKAWLKAGVLDGVEFSPTEMGTPQGGVISPLLANIALHGLEEAIKEGYLKNHSVEKPTLIRYADDFVILHSELQAIEKAAKRAEEWLQDMGLHLNTKKTKVTHTYTPYEGNLGFDFLGFSIRQFPMGKTHRIKNTNGKPLEFKAIIEPSKEAIQRHQGEIGKKIRSLRGAPQEKLIKELTPIIRGWANYYRTSAASTAYAECDHVIHQQLLSWGKYRHSKKGIGWVINKYWPNMSNTRRDWTFAASETMVLRRHRETTIIRPYAKVKGTASPYDGNLLYWSQRLRTHPMMKQRLAKLLQKQQGKCRWCELTFRDDDKIEIDHIDGNHNNDHPSNLVALHLHCHDEKHRPSATRVPAASVNNK
jgi:RNA-directed DNA polymerase